MKRIDLYMVSALAILLIWPLNSIAKTITIKVGETYTVDLNFSSSETVTGTWSKTGDCFIFVTRGSRSCTIKGNSPGSGTLSFKGVYGAFDYSTSYEVVVEEESNNGSDTTSEVDNSNDDNDKTEGWTDSGNYNISWYNKNLAEFTISTNQELAGLAYLVNNGYTDFKDKIIKMGSDIDLSGKNWITIGPTDKYFFQGSFDGQGHTINGLHIAFQSKDNQTYYGLFGKVENGTIKNLVLHGDLYLYIENSVQKYLYVGFLAGYCKDEIEKVYCKAGGFRVYRSNDYAGFTDNGCESSIGGIVGYLENANILYSSFEGSELDCFNKNAQYRRMNIGGLVGYAKTNSELKNKIMFCESIIKLLGLSNSEQRGDVKIVSPYHYLGGIVGQQQAYFSISYCRHISTCISAYDYDHGRSGVSGKYYLGGISANGSAVNCFSSVGMAQFGTGYLYSYLNFLGNASYRNSDLFIGYSNDVHLSAIVTDEFSTSFTREDMQTSSFLNDLNMYSTIELGSPVWTQDADGGYPYIAKLYEMPNDSSALKGDINGDGDVTGTDLVALTNIILGKSEKKESADLNGDGEVNGTDYVMLVNIVLGKQ